MKKFSTNSWRYAMLALLLVCAPAHAETFDAWKTQFRSQALQAGVGESTFDAAFKGIEPDDDVVELDQRQPEKRITFSKYRSNIIARQRVEEGRELLASNNELLTLISRDLGVQPQFIVALWGIESNYGMNMGDYSVVQSLATLAYEGRRSAFFAKELVQALLIIQEEGMKPYALTGSWAGAMGQCQFMPSSYRSLAVDYNGDGKRDIWNTEADVFASIANYLSRKGWQKNLGWGYQVRLPAGARSHAWSEEKTAKSLKEWLKLGVRFIGMAQAPADDVRLTLIYPDDDQQEAFLVTGNYDILMDWNRSQYFATTVGLLADAIVKAEEE